MDNVTIYVSHSKSNSLAVRPIISRLKQKGCEISTARDIKADKDHHEMIAQAISSSSLFIAMISDQYLHSDTCMDELTFARETDHEILLIFLDSSELPPKIAMRLGRIQALYRYQYENDDRFYNDLFRTKQLGLNINMEAVIKNSLLDDYTSNPDALAGKYYKYLPPGFRHLYPSNMIIASLVYLLEGYVFSQVLPNAFLGVLLSCLQLLIAGNYLGCLNHPRFEEVHNIYIRLVLKILFALVWIFLLTYIISGLALIVIPAF